MKQLLTALLFLGIGSLVTAQTTYDGNGATESIHLATSWDPATLPTSSGNVGTININATWDVSGATGQSTLTDFYLNITGGTTTIDKFSTGNVFSRGVQTLNGGTLNMASDNFDLTNGASFSINNASSSLSNVADFDIRNTSVFEMNSGALTATAVKMFDTGLFRMNGGTTTLTGVLGSSNNAGGGAAELNGGSLSAANLNFKHSWTLTMGGSTSGAATFGNFGGTDHDQNNVSIDWLTGSLMDLTLTSAASTWAETEWDAGRLTYNGDGVGTIGTWSEVTSAGGLDGTYSFDFDSGTNTLSLAVIPEPSSIALMGVAGLALYILRRRR